MKKIKFFLLPILFAIFLLAIFSCGKKNTSVQITPIGTTKPDTSKTFLALGDSYTIGQSVAESERFPNQTAVLLRIKNIKINDPKIIATTGWTTGNLISALNSTTLQNNYDIVTLLIGVNNQYQGRSIDEYKTEFTLLLNRSIQYAGNKPNHVFVLSIPDYSITPFAYGSDTAKITTEIDQFNSANKTISLQLGVNYLDITPISRQGKNDPSLIASDGLHPSGKQYGLWSALLSPLIQQVIK